MIYRSFSFSFLIHCVASQHQMIFHLPHMFYAFLYLMHSGPTHNNLSSLLEWFSSSSLLRLLPSTVSLLVSFFHLGQANLVQIKVRQVDPSSLNLSFKCLEEILLLCYFCPCQIEPIVFYWVMIMSRFYDKPPCSSRHFVWYSF